MTPERQQYCYGCGRKTHSGHVVTEGRGRPETNVCPLCYDAWPGALDFRTWANQRALKGKPVTTPQQRKVLERLAKMNKKAHQGLMLAQAKELARQRKEPLPPDMQDRTIPASRPNPVQIKSTETAFFWATLTGVTCLAALSLMIYAIYHLSF